MTKIIRNDANDRTARRHARVRSWALRSAGAALACAIASTASAQANEETASTEAAANEEIVVTGVREQGYRSLQQTTAGFTGQSVMDTPFQVTTFPIELLQDQQVRSIFDVSKNEPSVGTSFNGAGFYDSISIRGFYINNNSNYRRDGFLFQNQAPTPFENKAAVEFLKGLSGLRYGFSSPGGVVNYVLKRPTERPLAVAELFGNSNGGIGASIDLGGRFGQDEQFGVRFNAAAEDEHTFINAIKGPRRMVSTFVDWRATDRLLFEFEYEHQYSSKPYQPSIFADGFGFAPGVDAVALISQIDPEDFFLGQTYAKFTAETNIFSGRVRYEIADGWAVRGGAQYMHLRRDQDEVGPNYGTIEANGDYTLYRYFSPGQTRSPLSAEVVLEGNFKTGSVGHEVAVGAYLLKNSWRTPVDFFDTILDANGNPVIANLFNPTFIPDINPTAGPVYRFMQTDEYALFAADTVSLTEWLKVTGAVRYSKPKFERFDPDGTRTFLYNEGVITPTFGVVVKPASNLSVYASYTEGFEQGGTAPQQAVNRDEQLPPLTSKQYEMGVKADLFAGATLSAAVFEIEKGLERLNSQQVFVQDGRRVHRGAEATLAGEITKNLRVVAGATYLDAKIKRAADPTIEGKRPTGVAKWQANVFVDYEMPSGIAVNGGVFHSSAKFADDPNTISVKGFTRFDLGVRYETALVGKKTTFRLVAENITDERYFAGSLFGDLQFGAPRTVRGSVSFSF